MSRLKGNPECTLCPLHKAHHHVCTMGIGEIPAKIMVIHEAPTARDAIKDTVTPIVELEDAYYTTAIKCPTPKTPSITTINKCGVYLQKELRKVQPEYVLLIGAAATKAIFGGSASVKQMRGQFHTKDDVVYFPTILGYDEKTIKAFKRDVEKFAKATEKGVDSVEEKVNYEIIESTAAMILMLEELVESDSVVIDIETNGLDPRAKDAHITMVGIGLPNKQYILPIEHEESPFKGNYKQQKKLLRMLERNIEANYIMLVNHNIKFDLNWLHHLYGWTIKAQFDTMLAQHALNENLRAYGLKELSSDILNAPNYDLSKKEKQEVVPLKTLAKYCAFDTYYTRELYKIYLDEFERDPDAYRIFSSIYMPASNMLIDVEKRGVYIDENALHDAIRYLRAETGDRLFKLQEIAKINWNSTQQVANVLYNRLELPVYFYTPKGVPSVGVAALTELSIKGHTVVDILLEYRKLDKLLNTFAEDWSERLKESERLYPTFNLHKTVTGRTSCQDPNMQQVPKNKRIRSLVTAPPGKTLIECDLSQIELRIVAMLSQDPTMMEVYRVNGDIHTTTAEATSGKLKSEMTEEEFKDKRSKAKPVNFGFIYGMGWRRFIGYAKVNYGVIFTEPEARKVRTTYFQTYTALNAWHAYQRDTVARKGYVESMIGRKRRLPEIYSDNDNKRAEAERQAINSPVQSFASDLLLMAAIEINRDIPKAEIVALIHDAMLIECDTELAEEVAQKVKAIMEDPKILRNVFKFKPTVPLIADYALGAWGSK